MNRWEYLHIRIQVYGFQERKMVKVTKSGLMVHIIVDNIWMIKNMVRVHYHYLMVPSIKESLIMIVLKEMELMFGHPGKHTQDNGNKVKWMVLEILLGQMESNIQENLPKIGFMAMVNITGIMVKSIQVNGMKVFKMMKVDMLQKEKMLNLQNISWAKKLMNKQKN